MPTDLDAARAAFERGDLLETRRKVRAVLAAEGSTEQDKAAARALQGKISNDRAVLIMLGACVIFFLVIVVMYVGRGA
jgi:hypothetical protein